MGINLPTSIWKQDPSRQYEANSVSMPKHMPGTVLSTLYLVWLICSFPQAAVTVVMVLQVNQRGPDVQITRLGSHSEKWQDFTPGNLALDFFLCHPL